MAVVLVMIGPVQTPDEVGKAWEALRSHATDQLSALLTRRDEIEKRLEDIDGALNAVRGALLRKKRDWR